MKYLVYLILALSSLTSSLLAGTIADHPRVKEASALVDIWLEAQQDYEELPGLTFAVIHGQEPITNGGFGYANPNKKLPANADTIHSICSISKLFTGIATMRLEEQGKLRLDDPVSKYVDWFTIENHYPQQGEATVQNLLSHSSGLPREFRHSFWNTLQFPNTKALAEAIGKQRTLYPADTYFSYSNLGLSVSGAVVASVSGETFDDYVTQHILQPLGLRDTRPVMPKALHGKQLAIGHSAKQRDGKRLTLPYFNAQDVGPAAGFSSSANDLAKFAAWQFRLLSNGGEEVLQANTLRKMHRAHWLDDDWSNAWGIAFSLWQDEQEKFVGHNGHCPGYTTQLLMQPKDRIATVVMANASQVPVNEYAQQTYRIVAPAIKTAAEAIANNSQPSEAKVLNKEFEQYLGLYKIKPWGTDMAIIAWEGNLALMMLPNDKPMDALTKLRHVEDGTFRQLRKDGEPGDYMEFFKNQDGQVTHILWNESYRLTKVK